MYTEQNTVEINYYWGDDSFHSGVKIPLTDEIKAHHRYADNLCHENKPKHASVAFALVYVNGLYNQTVTFE